MCQWLLSVCLWGGRASLLWPFCVISEAPALQQGGETELLWVRRWRLHTRTRMQGGPGLQRWHYSPLAALHETHQKTSSLL